MRSNATLRVASVAVLLLVAGVSASTHAQTSEDQWQFQVLAYAYAPELHGSATIPTGSTPSITVDPNKIIENLNFALMGAFEARRGAWGIFTDIVYADVSDSKSATRALTIGRVPLPANITADVHLNVKSTLWAVGGAYRIVDVPNVKLDLLVGARGLHLQQRLNWQFSADVGPSGPLRQGAGDSNPTNWDGVLGAKGRWVFGDRNAWFVPYYVDLGAGDSDFTWEGMTGVGYSFRWGDVLGTWRYIDYQLSSHNARLSMSGPAIGIAFRW